DPLLDAALVRLGDVGRTDASTPSGGGDAPGDDLELVVDYVGEWQLVGGLGLRVGLGVPPLERQADAVDVDISHDVGEVVEGAAGGPIAVPRPLAVRDGQVSRPDDGRDQGRDLVVVLDLEGDLGEGGGGDQGGPSDLVVGEQQLDVGERAFGTLRLQGLLERLPGQGLVGPGQDLHGLYRSRVDRGLHDTLPGQLHDMLDVGA